MSQDMQLQHISVLTSKKKEKIRWSRSLLSVLGGKRLYV